jgi:tetratricopeptide (TPR) repeat protein
VEANPVVANTEASNDPDVPAMWRIDAAAPNMEQIYAQSDEVVEVVHTMDAEPVVYAHESTEPVQSTTSGVISLDIHPAQALGVRLDGLPELEPTLRQGFEALGNESWAQAAIAFQKLAARMPGDAAVFNNYGLSLLQRALTMAKSPDLELQTLASTQFESSILALREAAKSAPTEGTILLNLAHALLVSGRAEKAIGLVQMHDQTQPQTTVSGNLQAAALVSMGESGAAKSLLQRLHQDAVVRANLDRLSY